MSELDLEQKYKQGWNQYYYQRKKSGTEGQGGSRSSLEKEHRHPQSQLTVRWAMGRESYYAKNDAGKRVLLSGSTKGYDAFMQFWVSPSECSWNVPLRSAVDKTSGGAVHYEIQPTGRNQIDISRLDLPTLNITFQAGIITPGGYNDIRNGDLANIRPHGITNFYDFLSLLDQPNLTDDDQPNYVNIMYVSPVHGSRGIWLRGFFTDDGVNFTESADNPNTIQSWTASFLVCTSNPPLNKLRQSFQTMGVKV
jgi:hypothetical protein